MSRFLLSKKVKGDQKEYDPIVFGRADLDDYLDDGIGSKNVDTEVELLKMPWILVIQKFAHVWSPVQK